MKKLLYITNIPSPYRVEFWNELGKNYDLTVWFEAENESNREWVIRGLGDNFKYKFMKSVTFGIENHLSFEVLKNLEREPFDVYIMGCYSSLTEMLAILWFKFRRRKFFLNSDGGFPRKENVVKRLIKKYFISSAGYWLSSGKNCTEYLVYYGAKRERVFEYPFASVTFDGDNYCEKVSEDEFKKQYALKDKVLLTVSRFDAGKGLDVLIKAFAKLNNQNISLVLIGGGPEEKSLNQLVENLGVKNVSLIQFMDKEELKSWYRNGDIFILPTRSDTWGLVLNEAMNFGLPIIATDMCGASLNLIEEGENGYVFPVDNVDALVEKLNLLVNDVEKIERFGRRSKEIITDYTIPKMVESHIKHIEKVGN